MPIATNPNTGETVFLDQSGQWVPAKTAKNPNTGETIAFDGASWVSVAQKESSFLDKAEGVVGEVLNTATFGLADKVAGLGRMAGEFVKGTLDDKEQAFRLPKRKREAFREENPKTALAASIAGGFINPASRALGPLVTGGKTIPAVIGRGAGVGAIEGGLQAAGESEGTLADRAGNVGQGAGVGAILGGSIPAAIKAGGGAIRKTLDLMVKSAPQRQLTGAARKVAEKLEQDGLTLDEAASRLDRLGPEAAIIDLGENVQGFGIALGTTPGAGKTAIRKFVGERQFGKRDNDKVRVGGMVKRVKKAIENLIPGNVRTEVQKIRAAKSSEALYNEAFDTNQAMQSPALDSLLRRPSLRRALKDAVKVARERGENVAKSDPELTAALRELGAEASGPGLKGARGMAQGLKLKTLDRIKRLLWDAEQKAKIKDVNGLKHTEMSRAINDNRRELIRLVDDIDSETTGGAYAAARLQSGDDLANIEAMENGVRFFTKGETIESISESVDQMAPETKHFFRIGVAGEIKRIVSNTEPGGDAIRRILGKDAVEEKIFAAFDSPDLFKKYVTALENEQELFRTFTRLTGNSRTAENQALLKDAGVDPGAIAQAVKDLALGNKTSAVVNFGKGIKNKFSAGKGRAEEAAKILTGRDLGPLKEVIGPLRENKRLENVISELLIRGSAGPAGSGQ